MNVWNNCAMQQQKQKQKQKALATNPDNKDID